MSLKIFIFILCIFSTCYKCFLIYVNQQQRKKPLPAEVADIYDHDKYQRFLQYKGEYRKIQLFHLPLNLAFSAFFIFSDFYIWIEQIAGNNAYLLCLVAMGIIFIVELPFTFLNEWYSTFHIEEKYGMNHKTKSEFLKDFILQQVFEIILLLSVICFIVFVVEHIGQWTNDFTITYMESFLICFGIFAAFILIIILLSFLSLFQLKMTYQFTDLPEGQLRDDIITLTKDCKKKVKKIKVYNESRKSNSKNAFLLSFLWIREFGIADNFLNENSQRELMAVLAHETGHLRHKKDILDLMRYLPMVLLFIILVWLLPNVSVVLNLNSWILESFHLHYTNLYLVFYIIACIFKPIDILFSILMNYISRRNEYEADQNAVKLGYGEDLIQTFKKVSEDELVDVNPSYITEVLEYDHPGMYRRIKAIHEGMKSI